MIAKRMQKIDASGIRKVFDLAAKLKDPINLSIGQPDFDVSDAVKEIAIDAINSGFNRYTQTQGIAELNNAVLDYIKLENSFEPESVMICSGVSGALFLLILALVEPGDEVIFADPYFVMYKHLVNLVGGVPVYLDTYPNFDLDPDKLKGLITKKTKMLILNSPGNPTGAVTPDAVLKEIAEIARQNDIVVVSDEIYREFAYDGKSPSISTYYPEKSVVVNGFSKTSAMTGWRVGFAAGPAAIIDEMKKLQQYTFVCAPSFAQKAAVKALAEGNPHLDEYRKRRDFIYNGLVEAGYTVAKPGGAFYIFPECPNGDEDVFIEKALANNLLIIPGSVFSEKKGYFRISFASEMETLSKGLAVLKELNR